MRRRQRAKDVARLGPLGVLGTDVRAVAGSVGAVCGLHDDGGVSCSWVETGACASEAIALSRVEGVAAARLVAAADDFACAIGVDGTVSCWDERRHLVPLSGIGAAEGLVAGGSLACARERDGGAVQCWHGEPRRRAWAEHADSLW